MIGLCVKTLMANFRRCVNVLDLKVYPSLLFRESNSKLISHFTKVVVKRNLIRNHGSKSSYGVRQCDFELIEGHSLFKRRSKVEAIAVLTNGLGCNETEASQMLKNFPKLKNLTSKEIERKIEFCASRGIDVSDIVQNPWILQCKSSVIDEKLDIAKVLKIQNAKSFIPLIGVPLRRLKELQNWSESDKNYSEVSKIELICEKLKCSPTDLVHIFSIHKFVDRIPFSRLIAVIDILLDAGVVREDILKDIWVVRYSIEQISNRIRMAKGGGILQFKTWMVRCPEKTFNITLRRQAEKQTLLGAHQYSAVHYISSRLGVNQEEAKMILTRHPQLRGVGAAKLCNTLDFLLGKENSLGKGYDEDNAKFNRVQVWSSIRALCHSLDTMKERLVRLRALGYEPYSPSILYKSRRKFEEFVKKLEDKANVNQSTENAPGVERTHRE